LKSSNKKISELIHDESFIRWLRGMSPADETEYWNQWAKESLDRREMILKAHKLLNLPFYESDDSDLNEQLHALHQRIESEENRKIGSRNADFSDNSRLSTGYGKWAVAAAVLVVTFLGYFIFQNNLKRAQVSEYETASTNFGELDSLSFSDGTVIVLNSNSKIKYDKASFSGKRVDVWFQGEAYFSVKHNPGGREREFVVHTHEGIIKDLGTRFDIKSRKKETRVVLEEGAVEISAKDTLDDANPNYQMKPGELATISAATDSIQIKNVNTDLYTAWIKKRIHLDNTPVRQLVENIEETYGVNIKVNDDKLLSRKISGTIGNPDLKTLLKGLQVTLDIEIYKKGSTLIFVNR